MNIAKADTERLLNQLIPFAKQMLGKYGQFFPYGGMLQNDGEISCLGIEDENEDSDPEELIAQYKESFRKEAGSKTILASALIYDAKVIPPGKEEKVDAIVAELDHREGYSVIVAFPYVIGPEKKVVLESSVASKGSGGIFN